MDPEEESLAELRQYQSQEVPVGAKGFAEGRDNASEGCSRLLQILKKTSVDFVFGGDFGD
jgi:hypothetical protein